MERVLNLAGKNSSEIFQLRYPFSLLSFCDYDLSYFAENAIAVCDEALRSGELDTDRVTDLRNSLKNMHVYIEHNLRTVYDKIVLDCWIDYVCRRDGIGSSALWNRFIDCKTAFEKAVFVRLCEYRYNKGINEWLNLVRVQDYAKNKVYFLFSKELSGVEEACARRNYFDLMFSVTARELGCRLEDLGVTQVYSAGRLPSAPFMYPNISKDIVKNVLADFDYSDDYSDIGSYEALSDQIAMDAFSHMKAGLAQELGSYNMSRSSMELAPSKVYIPCGLKAAVDLEIDALLESGGWLARCKRCGRYYVRDSEYTEEYCSLPTPGRRTCLELYELEHPKSRVTPELERQCDRITDDMYSRVTSGKLSLKEYESWKLYLEAMKEKVNNGEIQPGDLISFITYSESLDISRSNPVVEVRKKEPERQPERVVKPFVPERISRSELSGKPQETKEQEEPEEPVPQQPRREGFFTSPSVERQRSQTKTPMSHVIRGEQSTGQTKPYQMPLEQPGEEYRSPVIQEDKPRPSDMPEMPQERGFTAFGEEFRSAPKPEDKPRPFDLPEIPQEHGFTVFGEEFRSTTKPEDKPRAEDKPETPPVQQEKPDTAPKPKVIRKNAAAISAYGKMSGAPLITQGESLDTVSRPEPEPQEEQDSDPFWAIDSIFDVLEQSENQMSSSYFEDPQAFGGQSAPVKKEQERPEKPQETPDEKKPRRSKRPSEPHSTDEVPTGIWTEDRHLFEEESTAFTPHEELNMLKDKKRRSSKTQRLFDAIMKEPDDNPNFRKK